MLNNKIHIKVLSIHLMLLQLCQSKLNSFLCFAQQLQHMGMCTTVPAKTKILYVSKMFNVWSVFLSSVYLYMYLVWVGAREKGDIVCSSKVIPHLLHLPIAFPFSPFGPSVLKPHLKRQVKKISMFSL